MPEAHARDEPIEPPRPPPSGPAGEPKQDRHQHQPHEQHRDAEDDPISFGGSGPDRANVKNTATITAPAAISRRLSGPGRRPSPRASWLRSSAPSAFGAPRGLTSRRRLRQGGTPTQVSCARIGRPSGPMLALAERRFDPGRCVAQRRPRAPPRRRGDHRGGSATPGEHVRSNTRAALVPRLARRGW